MSENTSPSGMKLPDEAKAQDGLDLSPQPLKATKIRKEIRVAFIAVAAVVILGIVFGILSKGNRQRKTASDDQNKPVQSAATVATKTVDSMQEQAAEAQRKRNEEAGLPGGAIPPGDVAGELNLPPTKIAQGGGAGAAGAAHAAGQLTPAQQRALLEQQLLDQAMDAPLGKGGTGAFGGQQTANSNAPTTLGDILKQQMAVRNALGAASGSGAGSGVGGGVGGGGGGDDDQNMQADKSAFLANARKIQEPAFQTVSRVRSLSPYEIQAGWDIPATLEQAINSDLPGEVRGIVRENVYDTATGRFLLIPQGSRVVGSYNSRVAYGQSGIQVAWDRLIYPDGSSVELGGLNGQDVRGLSGFRYKVDNHYLRLVSFALLTSAFAAGVELSQQNSNTGYYLTPQQAATQAVGQQVGELGIEVTRRNMNIQPTIKIPIGYRFNIRVRKDLIFDEPYRVAAALWK